MNKLRPQITPSHKLGIYSNNRRVNSVIRTLLALHGFAKLRQAAYEYVEFSGENHLTPLETIELYQISNFLVDE